MSEKRLALDQVPLGGGGGGGGGGPGSSTLVSVEAVSNGGGSHVEPTTSFSPVPGTLVSFTLDLDGEVYFEGFGTAISQGANKLYNCQIGLRIDGSTNFEGQAVVRSEISAPQAFPDLVGLKVSRAVPLTAGAHTAELVIRQADPVGPAVSAELATSALYPAVLTSVRVDPIAVVGTLTKQEAISQGGGNFSTLSTTFVAVPGTSVAVNLSQPQTVVILGYATTVKVDQNKAAIGIRVTSPGPTVIDLPGTGSEDMDGTLVAGSDASRRSLTATRSVALGAGSHTIELLLRSFNTVATAASIETNASFPAALTAVYTNPEEIIALTSTPPEIVNAGDISQVGILSEAARADHEHGVATAAPIDTGQANSEGSAVDLARSDHVHRTIVQVEDGGALVGSRPTINFLNAVVTDDGVNDRVDVNVLGIDFIVFRFSAQGQVVVSTKVDGTWVAPRPFTIKRVTLHREIAGSGGTTIVDVNLNGVTIFTTQANRPQIAAASGSDQIDAHTDMDVTAVAQDDKITIDVDQVETGNPEDISVTIEGEVP